MLARSLLAVGAMVLALLCVEGVHALWTGRSMLAFQRFAGSGAGLAMLDAERRAAATRTAGPNALALDPFVAFTAKADHTITLLGVPAATDEWGQRRRVGPPAAPGAARVVVLGDSVAFGWGLADDETYAHRLEQWLASTMADGEPAPLVTTIACIGWNVRNSCRHLRNSLARLRPDVVVFLPWANDLYDSFAVTEAGHVSYAFDPAVGATRPWIGLEDFFALLPAMEPRLSQAARLRIRAAGGPQLLEHGLMTNVLPESQRRWTALLDDLADLQDRVPHLLVHPLLDDPFEQKLEAELLVRRPELAMLAPFVDPGPGDRLPRDAHPNARCVAAAAWCAAQRIVAGAWIHGAGARPLPPLDPAYAARRRPLRERAAAERWAQEWRARFAAEIHDRVDLRDGTGFHQIHGGVAADGAVGRGALVGLRVNGGRRLRLDIERLPADAAVYPLRVALRVADGPWRSFVVPPPAAGQTAAFNHELSCPELATSKAFVDVQLQPDNWVEQVESGLTRLIALRLVAISIVPE
jgi:hypothetical protein